MEIPNHTSNMDMEQSKLQQKQHQAQTKKLIALGKNKINNRNNVTWVLQNHNDNKNALCLVLVHVLPIVKYIPSPLGVGEVKAECVDDTLVQNYKEEQANKIVNEIFQDLFTICVKLGVRYEWRIVESDEIHKAILEFVAQEQINEIFMGATSSKSLLKKGKIFQRLRKNAPESCQIVAIRKKDNSLKASVVALQDARKSKRQTQNLPSRFETAVTVDEEQELSEKNTEDFDVKEKQDDIVMNDSQAAALERLIKSVEVNTPNSTIYYDCEAGPSKVEASSDDDYTDPDVHFAQLLSFTMQIDMLKKQLTGMDTENEQLKLINQGLFNLVRDLYTELRTVKGAHWKDDMNMQFDGRVSEAAAWLTFIHYQHAKANK